MTDATIHLRVPAETKARWVRESRAEGKRLTDWITEKVETTMKGSTMPEFITEEFLDSILPENPEQRSSVAFLAHAYHGMARHPYFSPDWAAHNFMWVELANRMSKELYGQAGKDQPFTAPIRNRFRENGVVANAS